MLAIFLLSFVVFTSLGQSSRDSSNTTMTISEEATSSMIGLRICGIPEDSNVCHFEDNPKEICDICEGILCSHGKTCAKKKNHCEHECICNRPGEVPDENGICRTACRINLCFHNGTCRVEGAKQTCECRPGYEGDRCENVKNICLDEQPSHCPIGPYECNMLGVNKYNCSCARGYYENEEKVCQKVSHSVFLEIHFVETPYSEIYNDVKRPEYQKVREEIKYPFEQIYDERLVALDFQNFTQGSLVANLILHLKPAENGSQINDEFVFRNHILKCMMKQTTSPECFGKLGKVFLPQHAWRLQDERCGNVICPTGTQCQSIDSEAEKTRCVCASGYEGYGSVLNSHGTVIELCKDVNECSIIDGICEEGESCVNTAGSFECTTPCHNVKCPGYAKCIPIEEGRYRCDCSWIYAGSSCSFPWTLIFLSTTGLLLLALLLAVFLLWRSNSVEKKGRYGRHPIHPHVITVNQ